MNHPVDHLYRKWLQGLEPPASYWADAGARIVAEARRADTAHDREPNAPPSRPRGWPVPYGLAISAVMVAAAMGGWWLYDRLTDAKDVRKAQSTTCNVIIHADEQAARIRLFRELASLFGSNFKWFAEVNGQVSLGIETQGLPTRREDTPAFVRIALLRQTAASRWETVWRMDLIVRAGCFADIAPTGDPETRLQFWAVPRANNTVVFDTSLFVDGDLALASPSADVTMQGIPVEISSRSSHSGRLRMIQTILALEDTAG